MAVRRHKEAIHSGHFMVSNFEADEQDDQDDISIPGPSEDSTAENVPNSVVQEKVQNQFKSLVNLLNTSTVPNLPHSHSSLMIDVSLTKLFQCMSIAYRQKLTSPKWNRFLGMKLRWKDKFRLNNVIWRCWHMQFIKGHRKLVCAFANPMELDNHDKTEAGALLEGKYWKRKMNTILAGYKKWRIFYKNRQHRWPAKDKDTIADFNTSIESVIRIGKDDIELESLITDHDFFVDALFNSLGSQSVQFQDAADKMLSNSDFMQPSLDNLQPNIGDLMDLDPMAPLQDWLSSKLPEGVDENSQNVPVQNIKDIEVVESRFHPFSHASLREFGSYSKSVTTNSPFPKPVSGGKNLEFSQVDSQPSTSTFTHYSEYTKKKAPHPGKKLWALQQCQEQEQLKQQQQQQQAAMSAPSYPAEYQTPRHVPSAHVSVIQSQHVYQSDVSRQPQPQQQQRSGVIATNPASQQFKAPAVTQQYDVTYSTPSYLTPRSQAYAGAGAEPGVKSGSGGNNSELVQLLRTDKKRGRAESTPRQARGRQTRKHKFQESAEDLSNMRGKQSKQRVVSIPPPPSNGLPQPSMKTEDGFLVVPDPLVQDDAKMSSAEQKRRCTIKNGFDYLRTLIPSLSQTPNVKISKAALLMKGAEHMTQLSREKDALSLEVEQLRKSVSDLNSDISHYQLQLPTAGSAKGRSGSELQILFDKHVATCTMQNWKYFVFSKLMHPLLDSYDRTVSSSSIDDLARTCNSWLDQHVSLVQLRPLVLNSLKDLSVNTEILSEPHRMPQEALNHVQNIIALKKENRENNVYYREQS